jgi:hypothetical protein
MKNRILGIVVLVPLAIYSGCGDDDSSEEEPATSGGSAASGGAAGQAGGKAIAGSPSEYAGGAAGNTSTGAGGAGGNRATSGGEAGKPNDCPVCADLDEQRCTAAEEGNDGDCRAIYGHPFANPDVLEYAGCGNGCAQPDAVTSETCAMPAGETDRCFQLQSGFVPEGWTTLSEVEACSQDLGCE